MSEQLLQVKNLVVNVEDTEILHGIDLEINRGETHVLMGPNGAGKSTLGYALMGSPRYQLTNGQIWFKGQDITEESTDKRAKAGLFLSFQNPLEVPGITLGNFLRNALEQRTGQRIRPWEFRKELKKAMDVLQMDHSYADRDLNVGFSGGEKKKAEILQLLMFDAVRTVSKGIEEFQKNQQGSLLVITHSTRILESLHVDVTHVLADGKMILSGDSSLVEDINENGFEKYIGHQE